MDRRTFLKLTAAAGLTAALPSWTRGTARAADGDSPGTFWLFLHASGGWDPTLLCDPKGRRSEDQLDPVNTYAVDDIGEVGPFRYAPIDGHRAFFERFRDQLLVINGIDTQTNSHDVGTRFTWSGSMDPGTPALAALVAADSEPRPSLALLSNGGYDITGGLVAPTRLEDTGTVLSLAYPDRLDPEDPASGLFSANTLERMRQLRAARLQASLDAATLPRKRGLLSALQVARSGENDLARLAATIPAEIDDSGNELRRQVQVAMACFAAGVSVSATLEIGGFDTHGDHDRTHTPAMQDLIDGIQYAMDEAERHGIADRVVLVVGSDFARTPWYNEGMGKDHWSITSMMLMGPGIRGGRVIGATDELQTPLLLDPVTLAPSPTGVRITPADVHAALRELAGFSSDGVASPWPLGGALPLLG